MAMRGPALILLLLACAASAVADTVYLHNGRKFEEVVAEQGETDLRIRFPYGEIVLPLNVVARIERSQSVWQEYGERERRLRARSSRASEWLELALWADGVEYERGSRAAAREAAALEPQLDGLASLMRRLGYVHDEQAGEWLTEHELMRRRGYELWEDRWVPREVYLARMRERREAEEKRRQEARQERIARAIEALAVAQLSRSAASDSEPPAGRRPLGGHRGRVVAVFPGTYFPFLVGVAAPRREQAPDGLDPASSPPASFEDLLDRQPGSLMPLRPARGHLRSGDGVPPADRR